MPYTHFPLFQSHIDLAHHYWEKLVHKGDHVIDATSGNGHDTLKLATLALTENTGHLWALDIQEQALNNTRTLLQKHLPPTTLNNISLLQQNHAQFPPNIPHNSIKLITYNLGYLPGGNKSITTLTSTTTQSLLHAQQLTQHGGAISITLYPGHPEGLKEQSEILLLTSSWPHNSWNITLHSSPNKHLSPSLLLLQKQ